MSETMVKTYRQPSHLPTSNWQRNMSLLACSLYICAAIMTATAATMAPTTATATSTATMTTSDYTTKAKALAALEAITGANRKRVTLRSVDPLTRRSTVDKHFIRFGRNELDGDGGLNSPPRASINVRKREVFQEAAAAIDVAAGAPSSRFFVDENGGDADDVGQDLTRTLQSQPQILLADCWSSSSTKSRNRTRACLDRLRLRQHHAHNSRPHSLANSKQQQHRPSHYNGAIDDNVELDSDNRLRNNNNDDDDDADAARNQFVAVNDERNIAGGGDDNDNDDVGDGDGDASGEYAVGDLLYEYRRPSLRTGNASNGAFLVANVAAPLRGAADDDDTFVRTSRNKFSRNLFSRYDRGRDNFMRLGRSKLAAEDVTKEKTLPPPFEDESNEREDERYGDANDDSDNLSADDANWSLRTKRNPDSIRRFTRKQDSFMRLGRKHDSNFMRLGRTQTRSGSQFIRYGRNGPSGGDYDRWTRKHDNFMRLGRDQRLHQYRQSKREKAQNFMRLGRRDDDFKPRQIRKPAAENFMRFGRRTVASADDQSSWNYQRSPPLLTLSRFRRQTQPIQAQPQATRCKVVSDRSFSSNSRSGSCSYSSVGAIAT